MSSRSQTPVELSSARINRLLRPLRNRCSALAFYSSKRTRSMLRTSTSSSRTGSLNPIDGQSTSMALHILPPPNGSQVGFRKHTNSDEAEMAKRIYAVRDCFQDIVLNTKRHVVTETACRVKSLSVLCATVIGENMEAQGSKNSFDDENAVEGQGDADEGQPNVTDALYDAIPTEYRRQIVFFYMSVPAVGSNPLLNRCTLLSHAINIILTQCGDNATLLTRLFEVTLDHNLSQESSSLLYSLISLTFPQLLLKMSTPLICHLTHENFFVDLYTRWTTSSFPGSTFFRIFIKAIGESRSHETCASNVVHNVARKMYTEDFPSYLQLIRLSSAFAADREISSTFEVEPESSLLLRISIWLKTILTGLPFPSKGLDTLQTSATCCDDIDGTLSYILPLLLSIRVAEMPDGHDADFQAILVSLSTQWISVRRLPSQDIIKQLSLVLPRTSTFTPLVAKAFIDSDGYLGAFRIMVQDLSMTLASFDLLHLDASLLACALRFLEDPSRVRQLTERSTISQIQGYRHELIKLAGEAEDRFVRPSPRQKSCAIATPVRREMFIDISEWLVESPSEFRHRSQEYRKRRKIVDERHSIPPPPLRTSRPFAASNTIVQQNGGQRRFRTLLLNATSKRAELHPIPTEPIDEGNDHDFAHISSDDVLDFFGS